MSWGYGSPRVFTLSEFGVLDPQLANCKVAACQRRHVESSVVMEKLGAKLAISVCGNMTRQFDYPKCIETRLALPLTMGDSQALEAKLRKCGGACAKEWAASRTVAVHCNAFKHRGPLGVAALLWIFAGVAPASTMLVVHKELSAIGWHIWKHHFTKSRDECFRKLPHQSQQNIRARENIISFMRFTKADLRNMFLEAPQETTYVCTYVHAHVLRSSVRQIRS